MRIEILYVPGGCLKYPPTFERVQSLLASEVVQEVCR